VGCEQALEAYVARRFASWSGLPRGCRIDDLERAGIAVGGVGSGHLGASRRQVEVRIAALGDANGPSRVWLADGEIVLLDTEMPVVEGGSAALQDALGPPEHRLDAAWDVLTLPDGEWVWPSRGAVAVVNEPTGAIVRLAAFAPVIMDVYVDELRRAGGVREIRL